MAPVPNARLMPALSDPSAAVHGALAAPARRSSGDRWRAPLVLLGVAVVVIAGLILHELRSEAVSARKTDQRLEDVQYLITASDGMAWQIIAQGFPNFTDNVAIADDARQLRADLRLLAAQQHDRAGVAQVIRSAAAFERDLAITQRLVAEHRMAAAGSEVLVGVDGIAQLIQQLVKPLGRNFSERATNANSRLFTGTLIALVVTAVLLGLVGFAFSIGRRRTAAAARAALDHSERRFRALVQKATEVVLLTDAEGLILYATDASLGLLGRRPHELVGRRFVHIVPEEERAQAVRVIERARQATAGIEPAELTIPRGDGGEAVIEVQSANRLGDPDVGGIVLTLHDITTRREMEAQLRHQALHDPLTGLTNRTLFENRLTQALGRSRRRARTVAVLYLDLDGFKAINDSLGHAAGDELLRGVAERITECLRTVDTAARLGGDEFACLLEDLGDADEALAISRRVHAALARPIIVAGRAVVARASIGIAHCPDGALTAEQMIRHADLAMYKAKAAGRGGVEVFVDDLLVAARHRLDLGEDLNHAIARGELTLAYQPLVTLESGDVVGTEALLRWNHPRQGSVPPDRFIPIAEQSGLIVELGRWVLDRALGDLVSWSELDPQLRLNVNVAPRELAEPDYVDQVLLALARHQIEPSRLTLELTESEFLDDGETARRLEQLDRAGVRLAIDDFGTGQSSLARLQRLPVKQVKLDRSFLAEIDVKAQNATLVRSMIELGQALGLQMVAEGIEHEEQLRLLRETAHPVDREVVDPLGQGYLFARPQPAAAITELLSAAEKLVA